MSMVESKKEQVQQLVDQQEVETEKAKTEQKQPKKPVLSGSQLEMYKARDRYIQRARNKGISRTELENYIYNDFRIEKTAHKKKADSMIKTVLNEYHRYRNETMQALQDEIEQVLAGREKWAINKDKRLKTVYPKPVLNRDQTKVIAVKYEEVRAYLYPADLWEWMLEEETVKNYRKINMNRGRDSESITDDQIRLWISYIEDRGYSRRDVGNIFLISEVLVGKLIKGYLKE